VGSIATVLVVIVVSLAVIVKLIPALVQMVWYVLPSILVLWLIVNVLRGMVHKLLD
jgi:hypothetical protein